MVNHIKETKELGGINMAIKKILIGVIALLMVGCSYETETQNARTVGATNVGDPIRVWKYEGHSYLLYRQTIIHSESCKCKENKR